MKYVIWGWATAFKPDGGVETDPAILSALSSFVDADDLFQTDYIGGTPEEDAIAAALERSGQLRFAFDEGNKMLRVLSTFVARRALTPDELNWLRNDTLGQWSDGMGECLFVLDGLYKDYKLQPLNAFDVNRDPQYPFVEVVLANE